MVKDWGKKNGLVLDDDDFVKFELYYCEMGKLW